VFCCRFTVCVCCIVGNTEMMVYNADRTVEGYVHPNEPGITRPPALAHSQFLKLSTFPLKR
jgi:hypothetical protein